jgi:hypothetical protein
MGKLNWRQIAHDDYICVSPCLNYTLRAENIGRHWWWSVSYLGDEIHSCWDHSVHPKTKDEALQVAESYYFKHLGK